MKRFKIIYEDKFILVVDKPPHLLTVATDKEIKNTMYHQVFTYLKAKNQKVFIIHRLDKDTSGLLVFAKSEKIKKIIQNSWEDVIREYTAIVEGKVKKKEAIIKSYLKENSRFMSYSTNSKNGKLSITKYKIIKQNELYSLLSIQILTGRKNQIRVHMKEMGNPIIGDKKYESSKNPLKRLGLHANKIILIHPITKEKMIFLSEIPKEFNYLFKN